MTEPTRDELTRRIEQLERANRRWRRGSFTLAGLLAIGLVVSMAENYRQVTNARQRAELARQQTERALEETIHRWEDVKDHQERMRRLESKPKKANDIPLDLNDALWPLRHIPQQHWEPPHDRISPLERP
jgi:type VI protein secretion system component VasK